MELRHLKYFCVLADELNYSRAAEKLCITQPPLTRQIQQLEDELGAPLLVRNSKKVELTLAGVLFREEARKILNMVAQTKERTQQLIQGKTGQIDIGVFGSAILNAIPQFILAFRNQHPLVSISIYQQTKTEQIQALRDKHITVGFNRLIPEESDIVVERMYSEPLVVAMHEDDELAQKSEILMDDLQGKTLVIYPSLTRPSFADTVTNLFKQHGVSFLVGQEAPDVVTAIALVSSGFGVCVTPKAAERLRLPYVVYKPIKANPMPMIEMSCLYRRNDDSPILHSFLDIVRRYRYLEN